MAKGFDGQILHFGSIRLRITGAAQLKSQLLSLQGVTSQSLADLTLLNANNREPIILADFKDQRGQLQLKTTGLGETFNLSKITIFVRPIASGYPL